MIKWLIWSITCLLSTFGYTFLFYKFADVPKKLNLKALFIFATGVIFVTIIEYFEIGFLSSGTFFLFFPILFYCLKPMHFKKLLYYVIVVWAYGVFFDLIAMIFITLLQSFISLDMYIFYFESFMSIAIAVILFLVSHSLRLKNFTSNLYNKLSNINYFDFSLILFSIFSVLIGAVIVYNLKHLSISLLLILIIILAVLFFALLIKFKVEAIENTRYLKTLKENNDFYIKMDDENRIFKHNLTAKLLSIKSVSNEKANSLITDLIEEYNKNIKFSKDIKIIPYGLNGIVYEKIYPYLKELNINVNNNIDYDIFDYLKPRRYNVFVEKMVIALDNAIESTLSSNDKILNINLYDEDSSIIVEIQNTFGNIIDLDGFGNKAYSTKGKKRGLGIFSTFRNNEASMNVKIVNNYFICKIVAKKRLDD